MDIYAQKQALFHKVLEHAAERDAAAMELRFTPAYRKLHRRKLERRYQNAHRRCLMANVEHTRILALVNRERAYRGSHVV